MGQLVAARRAAREAVDDHAQLAAAAVGARATADVEKQHWAELGLDRLRRTRGRGSGFFSYNLFAISERGYARARALHAEYYERLRELVANDELPERVVLANLQLFPLDGEG